MHLLEMQAWRKAEAPPYFWGTATQGYYTATGVRIRRSVLWVYDSPPQDAHWELTIANGRYYIRSVAY